MTTIIIEDNKNILIRYYETVIPLPHNRDDDDELCIVAYNKKYCDRRCTYHGEVKRHNLFICTKTIPEVVLAGDIYFQHRTDLCLEYYS